MIWLQEQLQFLSRLQEWRGPIVDQIFRFLNLLDTDYFVLLLVTFVWIGFSWKWGGRLALLFIVSGLVNFLAKEAFCLPRPFVYDPSLAIVHVGGWGFPSGGAQNSLLLGGILIHFWKHRLAWPVGISYICLVSFSRIFLGVHFPVDVVGGWLIGALLLVLFIWKIQERERFLVAHARKVLLFVFLTALLCVVPYPNNLKNWFCDCVKASWFGDHKCSQISNIGLLTIAEPQDLSCGHKTNFSGCLGICSSFRMTYFMVSLVVTAIGLYVSTSRHLYFSPPRKIAKKILLGFLGISSAGVFYLLVRCLPLPFLISSLLQVTLAGLWVSLGASPIFRRIFHLDPSR